MIKYILKECISKKIIGVYDNRKELKEGIEKVLNTPKAEEGINFYDFDVEYSFGVCKGHHEMPVDDYVFEGEISDPTNINELNKAAHEFIIKKLDEIRIDVFRIYVTGLTVALISILNELNRYHQAVDKTVKIYLMHYNTKTGTYYEQEII